MFNDRIIFDCVWIYKNHRLDKLNDKFDIRRVTKENVNDASWFNSESEIKIFNSFLDKQYLGFYVYIDGVCGHRIWLFHTNERSNLTSHFKYHLPDNHLLVVWGETAKEYRGMSIYTEILSYLASEYGQERPILGAVHYKNIGSQKGMIKAGYQIIEKHYLFKFFRVKFDITKAKGFKISVKI
jgi:hypothetical protein